MNPTRKPLTDEEVALLMAAGELAADPRVNIECDHPEDQRREYHSEEKVRDNVGGGYVFTYDENQHVYSYLYMDWDVVHGLRRGAG